MVTSNQEKRCRIKQQQLGILAKGSIIGLEEAILTGAETYAKSVICKSTENDSKKKAILFKMKAETFKKIVATSSSFKQLKDNSVRNIDRLANQIRSA